MKPVFAVQITGRDDADLQLTVDALDASGLVLQAVAAYVEKEHG